MNFSEIFDVVNIGLVILDSDFKVVYWNRWMQLHSELSASEIVGMSIFDFYPHLNTARFLRSLKAVIKLGNNVFFTQRPHKYLFPFKPVGSFSVNFDHMRQNCIMGPLRNEQEGKVYAFITVQDVTAQVAHEQTLLELNITDPLTGTYNRRYLETRLSEEFSRYMRTSKPFSLIMLDIDFFKKVNDTYGHTCGDIILKATASMCLSQLREIDVIARYGGEEFCCVMVETELDGATVVAERLRQSVMELENNFNNQVVKVTISLGVAQMQEDIYSPVVLLEKADNALYEAKRTGRNRVVTTPP
ncbi:PAS/PAC sensor-containing diguanylate cyclase [Candidatus Magnetobacterium bavaricum]|uniref:diguanylate cyclase n=1 Tax=Candidatus Magnetobacterium bavaricum TaxID=29290 RepID=A0A0F3GI15_9BACT|nr:PAS/PAC sensor-containing diguanylate cyclase [Candidatus Magnetobacterium bavaricum]